MLEKKIYSTSYGRAKNRLIQSDTLQKNLALEKVLEGYSEKDILEALTSQEVNFFLEPDLDLLHKTVSSFVQNREFEYVSNEKQEVAMYSYLCKKFLDANTRFDKDFLIRYMQKVKPTDFCYIPLTLFILAKLPQDYDFMDVISQQFDIYIYDNFRNNSVAIGQLYRIQEKLEIRLLGISVDKKSYYSTSLQRILDGGYMPIRGQDVQILQKENIGIISEAIEDDPNNPVIEDPTYYKYKLDDHGKVVPIPVYEKAA